MYQFLRALDNNGFYSSPWIVKIKLNKSGMSFVTRTFRREPIDSIQVSSQISWLNNSISRTLSDIYEREWFTEENNL